MDTLQPPPEATYDPDVDVCTTTESDDGATTSLESERVLEDTEAAKILLSVTPKFGPMSMPSARDRTWSLDSLEALSDLCAREVESRPDAYYSDSELDPAVSALATVSKQPVPKMMLRSDRVTRASNKRFTVMSATAKRELYDGSSPDGLGSSMSLASSGRSPDSLCSAAMLVLRTHRVGAYTAEERARILKRFYAKRERRIWKKKIRYTCRKNLADRRIRVKGRFVKADDMPGVQDGENEEDEDHPEALGPLPTLPALGNGTVTRSSGRARSVSVSLPLRR